MLCGESHRGFKSHRYRQEEARNHAPNAAPVPGFSFPWAQRIPGTTAEDTGERCERFGPARLGPFRLEKCSTPAREVSHSGSRSISLRLEKCPMLLRGRKWQLKAVLDSELRCSRRPEGFIVAY